MSTEQYVNLLNRWYASSISKESNNKKLSDNIKNYIWYYHNALTALGRRIFTYGKLRVKFRAKRNEVMPVRRLALLYIAGPKEGLKIRGRGARSNVVGLICPSPWVELGLTDMSKSNKTLGAIPNPLPPAPTAPTVEASGIRPFLVRKNSIAF